MTFCDKIIDSCVQTSAFEIQPVDNAVPLKYFDWFRVLSVHVASKPTGLICPWINGEDEWLQPSMTVVDYQDSDLYLEIIQ